jgi:hypothetical protein
MAFDQYGNWIDENYYGTYQDPGLLPDGTYQRPRNPDYGQPGSYNDPYLGEPPLAGFDQTSGNWHPELGTLQDTSVTAPPPPPVPPPVLPPGPGPTTTSGGGGSSSNDFAGGFQWPTFTAPTFTAPAPFSYGDFTYDAYQAPEKFSYGDFSYDPFTAPTAEQAAAESGYAFARDQGLQAINNRASSLGALRTGGTLKDLAGWNQGFAAQNYGNVFNRASSMYDTNRNNAFQNYTTNRSGAFDVWGANELNRAKTYDTNRANAFNIYDTNRANAADMYTKAYGASRDAFDYQYQSAKDMFQPQQKAAELTFADLYSRWRDQLDATTRVATAGAGL